MEIKANESIDKAIKYTYDNSITSDLHRIQAMINDGSMLLCPYHNTIVKDLDKFQQNMTQILETAKSNRTFMINNLKEEYKDDPGKCTDNHNN